MKLLTTLLLLLLACLGFAQHLAPRLIVQHCTFVDEARAKRERDFRKEVGFAGVRSEFDPFELAWVKPDGTAQIGNYGTRILENAWRYWEGEMVVLTLQISPRLSDLQNDQVNAELVAYAYARGVRHWILLNEPPEWSAGLTNPVERAKLRAKVERLIAIVDRNAPGSKKYCPALHGWYEDGTALSTAEERQKNVARWQYLWDNEPMVRTLGFAANCYWRSGLSTTKPKALRPACVSELNRRPDSVAMIGSEVKAVAALPIDFVAVYCISGHQGFEYMTPAGVRNEARIAALKKGW